MLSSSYSSLDSSLWRSTAPTALKDPKLVHLNQPLINALGLNKAFEAHPELILSGAQLLQGSKPLAMAYAGHQFGVWAGQLGDGRGLLLGELPTASGLIDLHLKGAGVTAFSRMGDGKAVLRSTLREHLAGNYMAALGVRSTQSLGVVTSSEQIRRETLEPAAALIRTSDTHIRLGHFEWINAYNPKLLSEFTDYVIQRHFQTALDSKNPVLEFARQVAKRTALTTAQWQLCGFMHGVMNTDNLSVTGTTLDYGPYAFMEQFDPKTDFNHTDHHGRYHYHNQPHIAHWNLSVFMGQLLPLGVEALELQAALDQYSAEFNQFYQNALAAKLGLEYGEPALSFGLKWLKCIEDFHLDFTNAFAWLETSKDAYYNNLTHSGELTSACEEQLETLKAEHNQLRSARSAAFELNPKFTLRRWLLDQLIERAYLGDYSLVSEVFEQALTPYEFKSSEHWLQPSPKLAPLSCSS